MYLKKNNHHVILNLVQDLAQSQNAWFSAGACHRQGSRGLKRAAFTLTEGGRRPLFNSGACRVAFTLAEVLITLAIIGIVAILTVPTLIQKFEVQQNITALREFQAIITEAYNLSVIENGPLEYWYPQGQNSITYATIMYNKLAPHLKITKDCGKEQGCFPNITYKKIDGGNTLNWDTLNWIYKFQLANGMSVSFYGYKMKDIKKLSNSTAYGAISVDVNGFKGPNMGGRDMFSFYLTDKGAIPCGYPEDIGLMKETDENGETIPLTDPMRICNRKDCYQYCEGCAAWVLENHNMDYLYCDDLSWSGKRKCSK